MIYRHFLENYKTSCYHFGFKHLYVKKKLQVNCGGYYLTAPSPHRLWEKGQICKKKKKNSNLLVHMLKWTKSMIIMSIKPFTWINNSSVFLSCRRQTKCYVNMSIIDSSWIVKFIVNWMGPGSGFTHVFFEVRGE